MEQKNKEMSETYAEVRFFKWQKSDKSVSLRANSGSYGGGKRSACYCADKCGSLCSRDYKGVGSEYVYENKLIIEVISE